MTDSQSRGSVVVGDQAAPRVADGPVVPDAGTEGQQSLDDARAQPADRVGAVALQRELVLELVEDRLDPLANPAEFAEAGCLVTAIGAQEGAAQKLDELLDLGPGEALVADHRVALQLDPREQLGDDLALGCVARREAEGDRHPVRSAEQVELEAPEVARVRGAVAIGGVAGELRALDGLARLPTGDRRRVDQAQVVTPRGRDLSQVAEQARDLARQRPDALVIARLAGDVGEQVAQAPLGEADEAPLLGAVEQDLGDGEADHLGVTDLRLGANRMRKLGAAYAARVGAVLASVALAARGSDDEDGGNGSSGGGKKGGS